MSFIVAISGEVRSVVLEGVSADARKPEHEEGWTRRVAAYAIILSWIQLIFVLGRFPTFGVLALMFFTILKNMVKVTQQKVVNRIRLSLGPLCSN